MKTQDLDNEVFCYTYIDFVKKMLEYAGESIYTLNKLR